VKKPELKTGEDWVVSNKAAAGGEDSEKLKKNKTARTVLY